MPDDTDRAQERDLQYQADMELERRYQAAKAEAALQATGECLYCGEPLTDGLRFCDPDCRDAHDHELKLKRMQGVA
jgi:hypothetical protein